MNQLTSYAAEYLINNETELNHFLSLYSNFISDDLVTQDYSSLHKGRTIESLINLINSFNDLTVKNDRFEYVYYVSSLFRKACDEKKINIDKLLKVEQAIVENKEKEDEKRKMNDLKPDNIFIIKKRYFKVLNINTNYSQRILNINRGSTYRGVSKNGNRWQTFLMHKQHKYYLGTYDTEKEAAVVYDTYAMCYFKKKAKTNFVYSKEEIKKIRETMKRKGKV